MALFFPPPPHIFCLGLTLCCSPLLCLMTVCLDSNSMPTVLLRSHHKQSTMEWQIYMAQFNEKTQQYIFKFSVDTSLVSHHFL